MVEIKENFKLLRAATLCIILVFSVLLVNVAQISDAGAQTVECKDPARPSDKCGAGQCLLNDKCIVGNPASRQLIDIPDFEGLIKLVIQILLSVAGAFAVIFLVIGGFQYIAARGNEEAMEKAKKTVTGAIIGIVIIVMAFAIVAIVNQVLTETTP